MAVLVRDKDFYRTLLRLAVPIALQNFLTFGVTFIANLMVGTLGENIIAGVYMGNQLQTFLQFYVTGIDGAVLVLAAQYWGRRDAISIRKLVAMAGCISLAGGLLLTVSAYVMPEQLMRIFTSEPAIIAESVRYIRVVAVSYIFFSLSQIFISSMRSVENVKIGMYTSLAALAVSVALNYVFIFGKLGVPAMGVVGVAMSTAISRAVELIVITVYMLFVDKRLHMRLRDFIKSWDLSLLKDFARYGLPVLGGNVVWAVNVLTQSGIIGRMGTEAVASVSIVGMLNNLVFVWVNGLGAGVGIITGQTVGAGKYNTMKLYAKTIQLMFAALGVVYCIVMFLTKDWFLSLYNINDATRVIAQQFMVVMAVAGAGRCYQAVCLSGLVKAGGDTSFVFRNDTIFVFAVVLPSALIAMNVFHMPPWVVYACLQSDQILKCFVAVVKINRFRWMKNLTHQELAEET